MSTTGASSGSEENSSNYNYLSFFATGSYGRKLEGKRSRDPTVAKTEEEKRKWWWIAGVAVATMFVTNIAVTIGLVTWKYKATNEEPGFEGNIYELVKDEMKAELQRGCRSRYRKTEECSQVSAQIFLVASPDRDSIVWSDKGLFDKYNRSTPGAFRCEGKTPHAVETDMITGKFIIKQEAFYQVHSHVSVHSLPPNSTFQHSIIRDHHHSELLLADRRQTSQCPASTSLDVACFSSSLLATEHLRVENKLSIRLKVNNIEVKPTKVGDIDLVYDGRSSYFGIIRLGNSKKT